MSQREPRQFPARRPSSQPAGDVFDDSQRDFYAHPLNVFGKCVYLAEGLKCPPASADEEALLSGLPADYLIDYAVNVVGIDPGKATVVPDLVPLILAGLGYK